MGLHRLQYSTGTYITDPEMRKAKLKSAEFEFRSKVGRNANKHFVRRVNEIASRPS